MTHPQIEAVAGLTEQLANLSALLNGFVPRRRYRKVTCTWLTAEEGYDDLWALLVCSLTPDEVDGIPVGDGVTLLETWRAVAPYVKEWNCQALDSTTGALVAVPPPAEIGADAFRAVDSVIGPWIAVTLKRIYLGIGDDARPKEQTAVVSMDATASDGDSD